MPPRNIGIEQESNVPGIHLVHGKRQTDSAVGIAQYHQVPAGCTVSVAVNAGKKTVAKKWSEILDLGKVLFAARGCNQKRRGIGGACSRRCKQMPGMGYLNNRTTYDLCIERSRLSNAALNEFLAGYGWLGQKIFDMAGNNRPAAAPVDHQNPAVVTRKIDRRLQPSRTGTDDDAVV